MIILKSESWQEILKDEFKKKYFLDLMDFLDDEYQNQLVFPTEENLYTALEVCNFDDIKVVILGQDPYHDLEQAHGLSFSVQKGVNIPPSLRNIYKELCSDIGIEMPVSGDLFKWAAQGVLLLNATLTVRAHQAGSHQKKGWEVFTDKIISVISEKREGIVFVLWGAYAQKKEELIDKQKHFVIKSVHPSPLSARRGFFDSKPFSKTNQFLQSKGITEIDWSL